MLERFNQFCAKLAVLVSGVALCVMTAIIAWQIFGRFVLNQSPTWSVPLALLLMTYIVLLMSAMGVREHFHLRLWLGIDMLPLRHKRNLLMLSCLVIIIFGAVMLIFGGQLIYLTAKQAMPVLGVSTAINYIPVCISGLLMISFALEDLLHLWFNKKQIIHFISHHPPEELEEL